MTRPLDTPAFLQTQRRLEGRRETPRVGVAYTAAAAFLPARRPKVSALPRLMPATTTG